jgi:hypothetical protein
MVKLSTGYQAATKDEGLIRGAEMAKEGGLRVELVTKPRATRRSSPRSCSRSSQSPTERRREPRRLERGSPLRSGRARVPAPDGTPMPSVTPRSSAPSASPSDFEALRASSDRIAQAIDLKREIGTALHADAHAFDDHDLDWSTVDPRVLPYLEAWVTFRENTGLQPVTRERRVYNALHGYAGTLDGIFDKPNGGRCWWTSKPATPRTAAAPFRPRRMRRPTNSNTRTSRRSPSAGACSSCPEPRCRIASRLYRAGRTSQKFQAFVTTYHCQPAPPEGRMTPADLNVSERRRWSSS